MVVFPLLVAFGRFSVPQQSGVPGFSQGKSISRAARLIQCLIDNH